MKYEYEKNMKYADKQSDGTDGQTSGTVGMILRFAVLAVSVFLAIGIKMIFPACPVHEDGAFGSCHWAEQAVLAAAIMMTAQAVILVIARSRSAQRAVSAGIAACGIVTMFIPNVLIPLCMMPSMRCLASMRPWVLVCGIVTVVLSLVNLFLNRRRQDAVL